MFKMTVKKILVVSIFVLLLVSPVVAQDIAGDGMEMDGDSMNMPGMTRSVDGRMQMFVDLGPALGGQMAHVYVDIIAFLITLFLVMKVGRGKIRYPILILGLTFLVSALIPLFFGHNLMWLVALIKSIGGMISIIWFISIFGLFSSSSD